MNFNPLKYSPLSIFSFSVLLLFGCFESWAQGQYRVLHIGDSHLQPNNLSGSTRYELQKAFGNAGRGLIFPYILAKTNGPKDFNFTSNITWTSSWITKPSTQAIGLTGISIKSKATNGWMRWSTGKDSLEYPATKGSIVYEIQDCQACFVKVNGVQKSYEQHVSLIDTLNFLALEDTSELEFQGCVITLLDIIEGSDQSGIIYHSTGVAGATFKSYNDNPHFEKGLKLIKPNMVVISLGTNESVKKWDALSFEKEVQVFVQRIRTNIPNAQIVLVLPNENYLKVDGAYVYNAKIDSVHQVLKAVSKGQNLLVYDQQEAMGGRGCMLEWHKQGLVNEDHIHFLRKGYQKQGLLLAQFLRQNIKLVSND
ncbi:MAG: GDSL-type esterase/lipase family protein [Flavobacteriales bacterium]